MRLVSSLACARVEADPLRGLDDRARMASEKLLAKSGFARDGRPNHPGAEVDFELIAALAKYLGDPDAKFPQKYRFGVRMGYRPRLPGTPAVYPRKSRWAAHVGAEVEIAEWAAKLLQRAAHRRQGERDLRRAGAPRHDAANHLSGGEGDLQGSLEDCLWCRGTRR